MNGLSPEAGARFSARSVQGLINRLAWQMAQEYYETARRNLRAELQAAEGRGKDDALVDAWADRVIVRTPALRACQASSAFDQVDRAAGAGRAG